jgi:hypothetical protein
MRLKLLAITGFGLMLVVLGLQTTSNSIELSSQEPGAAGYTAIAEINDEINRALVAGQAIYKAAVPHLQDFAQDTLNFIRQNQRELDTEYATTHFPTISADEYQEAGGVFHSDYLQNTNLQALVRSSDKMFSRQISNQTTEATFDRYWNRMQQEAAIKPYLLGNQFVR